MSSNSFAPDLERLRELVVTDFRRAVATALEILSASDRDVTPLLAEMDGLAMGRVRQVVAIAAQKSDEVFRRSQGALERWAHDETDEFARRAMLRVLQQRSDRHQVKEAPRSVDHAQQQLQVYRYVAERLAHRVGNAFMSVDGRVESLRSLAPRIEDSVVRRELDSLLADLSAKVKGLGPVVGYPVSDRYFDVQVFEWMDYLRQASAKYSNQFTGAHIAVRAEGETAARAKVRASDFHLYTICWNLWVNSQQATTDEPSCDIVVVVSSNQNGEIVTIFTDNGTGFPASFASDDRVFLWPSSTMPEKRRGRGLLEVADAVDRVRGKLTIVLTEDGTRRIVVTLPTIEEARL